MQTTRHKYLIAYDVSEHKRLAKIHKKVEAYAIGGQKSFYECWLTEHELSAFQQEMKSLLNLEEDRLFIFQIPNHIEPMLFGKAKLQSISPFMLV